MGLSHSLVELCPLRVHVLEAGSLVCNGRGSETFKKKVLEEVLMLGRLALGRLERSSHRVVVGSQQEGCHRRKAWPLSDLLLAPVLQHELSLSQLYHHCDDTCPHQR